MGHWAKSRLSNQKKGKGPDGTESLKKGGKRELKGRDGEGRYRKRWLQ